MSDLLPPPPRQGPAGPTPRPLLVVRDPIGVDASRWSGLVDDLCRAFDLVPSELLIDMGGPTRVARLLRAAAAAGGPVLVLPPVRPDDVIGSLAHLRRVVVASGDSAEVVEVSRLLLRRLRSAGVHATVLVVLSDGAVPAMWDGAGHHAAAWREELGRRHGGPDQLEVVPSGDGTGAAILRRARNADILVMVWRQAVEAGRAEVVRAVLEPVAHQPTLLVPMSCMAWLGAGPRRRSAHADPAATVA